MRKFVTCDNHVDEIYLQNLALILTTGEYRSDRTGTDTISRFGDTQLKFDLRVAFPLLTTKYVHFHAIVHELIWMLSGSTNIRYLKENNVRIWDEWIKPETAEHRIMSVQERLDSISPASSYHKQIARFFDKYRGNGELWAAPYNIRRSCNGEKELVLLNRDGYDFLPDFLDKLDVADKSLVAGELGPVYGSQWRFWEDIRTVPTEDLWQDGMLSVKEGYEIIGDGPANTVIRRTVDQIAKIEHQLKNNPDSRRIILSGWNVAMIDEMALPPCHTLAQWYVSTEKDEEGKNYLDCKLYMRSNDSFLGKPFNIAQYALLTHMFAHVANMTPRYYFHSVGDDHIYSNHVKQVREQLKRPIKYASPSIKINGTHDSVLDIKASDIELIGYEYFPAIKAPVAV